MPVRSLTVDLDEGAGQLLGFPGCTGFARAQAHRHILDAHRLPGTQREVAHDAVPLIEQPENRNALGHWRHPRLLGGGSRHIDRDGLVFILFRQTGTVAACGH